MERNSCKSKEIISDKSVDLNENSIREEYKMKIVWRNVIAMTLVHVMGIYGLYLGINGDLNWKTVVWLWFTGAVSAFGILAGAHRLWSHRGYKAKWPLRLVLMILQTVALQNDIYEWCRDHRVHHKYSETDADPHNSNRGFFFAHIGWLLCKKHPDVRAKGRTIDMSDLWSDPIVRFQRRYYIPLIIVFWGFIPVYIPMHFWGENIFWSISSQLLRYTITLNQTWLVNSAAHLYGNRPYDKTLNPRENRPVVYATLGEGYHNYHHTFPWDYSASEYGWRSNFNPATALIDFCAFIGLAYDRKVVSHDVIEKRIERTGDGNSIAAVNFFIDLIYGIIIFIWPLIVMLGLRTLFAY